MALFQRKTTTAAERMQENAYRMRERMRDRAKEISSSAQWQRQRIARQAGRLTSRGRRYIRLRPLSTVGVVALLSLLIGFGLRRAR